MKATIIIPTRDRCETLEYAIRTCVQQDYENLEIIVSDNACEDATPAVVSSFDDPRIKYVRTNARVSMTDNWEFAISHATGDFISVLGDDDGFTPGGVRIAMDLLKSSGADCVGWSPAHYGWPSHPIESSQNTLTFSCRQHAYVRSATTVWRQFTKQKYGAYNNLIGMYACGFVPMSLIRARVSSHGRFFKSSQPDIYAAIHATQNLKNQVFTPLPLAIAGCSGKSNGACATLSTVQGEVEYSGELAKYMTELGNSHNHRLCIYKSLSLGIADAWLYSEEDSSGKLKDDGKFIITKCLQWACRECAHLPDGVANELWRAIQATAEKSRIPVPKRLDLRFDLSDIYPVAENATGVDCIEEYAFMRPNAHTAANVADAADLIDLIVRLSTKGPLQTRSNVRVFITRVARMMYRSLKNHCESRN